MLEASCHLPKDFAKQLGVMDCSSGEPSFSGPIKKLKNLLEIIDSPEVNENETTRLNWGFRLDDFEIEYKRLFILTADERFFSEFPLLKTKRWDSYTLKQQQNYKFHIYDIKVEVLDAKYKKHKNWKRVEGIFSLAKENTLHALKDINLPQSLKEKMMERLATVELSLPYSDPRIFGSDFEKCGRSERNAFYIPSLHKFTVCAGYFNGVQSDGFLYLIISHEIGHSIDPRFLSSLEFNEHPMMAAIKKVVQENGNLNCNDWEDLKNNAFIEPSEIFHLDEGIKSLNQCLIDRSQLTPLNIHSIKDPAKKQITDEIDSIASHQIFLSLIRPKKMINWKEKVNPSFLNPFVSSFGTTFFVEPYAYSSFIVPYIFTQEYRCQKLQNSQSYIDPMNTPKNELTKAFSNAIESTKQLGYIYYQNKFAYEGLNNLYLAKFGLSRSADESWSDWIALRSMKLLLSSTRSIEKKRAIILSAQAVYCETDPSDDFAVGFDKIEKSHSTEPHPGKRKRRLRIMSPFITKEIQCVPGNDIKGTVKSCGNQLLQVEPKISVP